MTARSLIIAGVLVVLAGSARAVSAAQRAPSQASAPLGVTALAGKYTGAGVTIGVISDSFSNPNCDYGIGQCATTAAEDIASGNLPGPGNPNGDTTPVVVIQDGNLKGEQDRGRAMLQIIYGLAPKARLCFSTFDASPGSFANAVAALASAAGPCKANIIVEDGLNLGPFFGDDGDIAAINQAVAAGVTYISAAGDLGPGIYDATFSAIADSVARSGSFGNLQLSQVPTALTAGGFHNFSTTGTVQLSFSVSNPASFTDLGLGWDDPVSPATLSANYHLLVFDADGTYRADLGAIGATHPPNETIILPDGSYQIAISLAAPATSATATRLRIVDEFIHDVRSFTIAGLPARGSAPSLAGHAAAAASIAVASYRASDLTAPEPFNSNGPFTSVFDPSGNRLATPEIRLKPDVAGVDGLDITFAVSASTDFDNDGFPNAFGSSFAAASVAAVAALTIQAAGGAPTPAQVSSWLKQSASHAGTWAASDGYGYVNAVRATTLAASANSGCSTSHSLGASWMIAVAALLAAARARARRVPEKPDRLLSDLSLSDAHRRTMAPMER